MIVEQFEQLDAGLERQIAEFLRDCPAGIGACAEHDPRWLAALRQGLGHRPVVLIARDGGGAMTGYLPLMLVATRLFGRFLVSLPYVNRAGLVARDPAVAAALIDRAVALAERHNVRYLELRQDRPAIAHDRLNGSLTSKVRMVRALPDTSDILWKALNGQVRNLVRKGAKHDLSIAWGGRDLLDGFYGVMAVNMRDLGTPIFSRRLFAAILDRLAGQAELAVVSHAGQPVAAALLVHDAGTPAMPASSHVPSASSLRAFNHTSANMWMYHQLLVRAIERGSREFDFGRSSIDSGTYKFKAQWGAQPRPTVWQYHTRRGDMSAMRPENPSNQRKIAVWKRLPVWLTRLIGPPIVRGIP